MTFLLDTDICSAPMRRPGRLAHRFIQHAGRLAIPTIVLAELYSGAYKHPQTNRLIALIRDLLTDVSVLNFDEGTAEHFGKIRGGLLQRGVAVATADLMIASVAIQHGLTLVTHNLSDYQNIPDLLVVDWLN